MKFNNDIFNRFCFENSMMKQAKVSSAMYLRSGTCEIYLFRNGEKTFFFWYDCGTLEKIGTTDFCFRMYLDEELIPVFLCDEVIMESNDK